MLSPSARDSLDNPASQKFVKDFQAAYKRVPTDYAMQAYDTAQWIASGLKAVNGDLDKADAFRAAMRKASFVSLRGKFALNTNHHPIQDLYLMRLEKGANGELGQKVVRKIVSDDRDSYASACKMPS